MLSSEQDVETSKVNSSETIYTKRWEKVLKDVDVISAYNLLR